MDSRKRVICFSGVGGQSRRSEKAIVAVRLCGEAHRKDSMTSKINYNMLPKVLGVIGSQNFPKLHYVSSFVKSTPITSVIVSGGAKGVDTVAEETAKETRRNFKGFYIDRWEWDVLGKRIARIRNEAIVRYVKFFDGAVIVFMSDYGTPGSGMVMGICTELDVPYVLITENGVKKWTTRVNFVE